MSIIWRNNQEGRRRKTGKYNYRLPLTAFFLFICFIYFTSFAEASIEVSGIKRHSTAHSSSVIIDLSAPTQFIKGRLSNPERLFIDIKNARLLKISKNELTESDRFLKGVRVGQFNLDTVRVVLDLQSGDIKHNIELHKNIPKLVVELFYEQKKAPSPVIQREEENLIKRRIVLDPGHGGHDPGAVGYSGLFEKDVVLDIALKVREIMNREHPSYEIILTRDSDIFIPLNKRAEIANKSNADMFISIHANASYNRMAQGIETYILNWTDDEEAMKVAARENAISLKEMKRLRDELSLILASLESEAKRDESIKVAGFIHSSLVSVKPSEYFMDFDRGIKQALFYVLVGAKMPSTLLEVGFITNPLEEKMLGNETYRLDIAKSIVSGILKYFSEIPTKRFLTQESSSDHKEGYSLAPAKIKYSKLKR